VILSLYRFSACC